MKCNCWVWILIAVAGKVWAQDSCMPPPELQRVLEKQNSAAIQNAIGAQFAKRSQSSCALEAFANAIRLDPQGWEGHHNMALSLLEAGRREEAIRELQEEIRIRPGLK